MSPERPVPHPLVEQLRFARSEFRRGLDGVTDADAAKRLDPMNCIAWNVGHLAWQEQRYWLHVAQDLLPRPDINDAFAYGAPGSTPALSDMWAAWEEVTRAADPWLDAVTTETLESDVIRKGRPVTNFGSLVLRTIYHYWYHTGENLAIRQMLGHTNLPDFVGDIDNQARYRAH